MPRKLSNQHRETKNRAQATLGKKEVQGPQDIHASGGPAALPVLDFCSLWHQDNGFKISLQSQVWRHVPVIPALGRIASLKPARTTK